MSDSDSNLGEFCAGLNVKKLASPNTNWDSEFEVDGLLSEFDNLKLNSTNDQRMENMNAAQQDANVTAAVANALAAQKMTLRSDCWKLQVNYKLQVPQCLRFSHTVPLPLTGESHVANLWMRVKSFPKFYGSQ